MLLFHVSPSVNRESIRRRGLLRMMARGRSLSVWACTQTRIEWAIRHVMGRHREAARGVDVWVISIDRDRAKKTGRRGVWRTEHDVGPSDVAIYQQMEAVRTENGRANENGQ